MSGALLEKIPLLGGEFEICRFANKPRYWWFRQYIPAGPNNKRTYIKRSLKTEDRAQAERRAYEEWRKLKTIEEDGGSITAKSVQDLMDDWIEKSYQRVITGEIQEGTWRSKRSFFTNSLVNYFKSRGVKRITDLQADTFDDYRFWRTTEGWKFYKGSNPNQRKPPTDGTVNSEIGLINEWYNNYLIPKGYVRRKPLIRMKQLDQDDLSANPPIPVKQWELIWRYLKSWSESKVGVNRAEVVYWRQCFRHYLLVAYNLGNRPTEMIGRFNNKKDVLERGVPWDDVEIIPQTRWSESQKKEVEDKPISLVHIRKTKTKVPREVPCRAAEYLERWRDFAVQWRKDNGYPPLKGSDLIFANPKTNKPYSYTMFTKAWSELKLKIGDKFEDNYTLYSTRSSFVTNLLEEGVSADDVCKLTGHSYFILRRHYDRMKMRNRIPEVTKRRYGQKDQNPYGSRKLL